MPVTGDTREFDALLELLKRVRGFDFTGYKRTTLQRRVEKRMAALGLDSYARYLELLEADTAEFTQLFNTLLINVTRFFRDESPWRFLADDVLPGLLARREDGAPFRVWSAGCASGEEAYTLAILLAEALGPDRFRERVKIYATDVDEEALATARSATYADSQVEDVPTALLEKYFERTEGRYVFTRDLRRNVIFGRNDLVQDAPISRIDVLVCRNTLMYFNAPTQSEILGRFHYALSDSGVLFLGRAETLLTHTNAFAPVDLKRRIFTKVPRFTYRDRLFVSTAAGMQEAASTPSVRLHESAFEAGAEAQIVVDRQGVLTLANERARVLFGLSERDLGRPLQDLEVSYRPVELRSLLEQCYTDHRPVIVRDIVWRPRAATEDRWIDLEVKLLADDSGAPLGATALFTDLTTPKRLSLELQDSRQRLEAAYEELQSTNEELETTNEELQSTVEELETTNEELHSTNEELETMNEELQSTNEELQTINDELRRRSDELNDVTAFMDSIFSSLQGGVVVIDGELRVLVWNARSEELWGIRSAEAVGASFLVLDIGLPVTQLAEPIRDVLAGRKDQVEVSLLATNRRGRALQCRVRCMPLLTERRTVRGVILVMDEGR
jgi:two-component system, chemotaxis family, CheB/CheR fusion protein